jgi:exonuclease III
MLKFSTLLALIFSVTTVSAHNVDVYIASFNLAWAGTEDDFKEHSRVCTLVNWCSNRPFIQKGESKPSVDAIVDAKFCSLKTDLAAGDEKKSMMIAPCSAYKKDKPGPFSLSDYNDKLSGLAKTIDTLIVNEKVSILAFQEFKSEDVIKKILGKHISEYSVCAAKHVNFQTVGFAWKKDLTVQDSPCKEFQDLAIPESAKSTTSPKRMRPGIALNVTINQKSVSILNVHLKSGCANIITNSKYPGNLLSSSSNDSCSILQRQVKPLTNWLTETIKQTSYFVLLGDMNRRIDEEELVERFEPGTFGQIPKDKDNWNYSYLWHALSSIENQKLFQVPLSKRANDNSCKDLNGLDHIVISQALYELQQPALLFSTKIPAMDFGANKIASSDHCPRITKLTF